MKNIWIFLISLCGLYACSHNKPTLNLDDNGIPKPTQLYVNDFTNDMLDSAEVGTLNRHLHAYEDSTTNQIVVICLKTFPKDTSGTPWNLEDLSLEIARTWKIGQKGKNNGVLLLIILDEKKDRIEVGYGLEGKLPDLVCKYILEHEIQPNFKDEKYNKGITNAITAIERSIAGEYQKDVEEEKQTNRFWNHYLIALGICAVIGAIFFYPIFVLCLGGLCGGVGWYIHSQSVGPSILAVLISAILVLIGSAFVRAILSGDMGSSTFSSSGSSGGGSSSSGSFSGGGGSFGGGGASGGW